MIGKEWCFSATSVYVHDSGAIVLKNFQDVLTGFLEEDGNTHNRLPTLTIQLQLLVLLKLDTSPVPFKV